MNEKLSRAGIPKPYDQSFCQLKRLLWSLIILSLSTTFLYAEGSVDFIDYPGFRLFYGANEDQQLKVYVAPGEFINLGTSHIDVSGGTISVYRPDGTLHTTFDNTGDTQGLGIIFNDIQEKSGPTGGGSTMGSGYTPGVITVGDSEGGIWTVTFNFPDPINLPFSNIMNDDPWTRALDQPTIQRGVLAWDVTVSQGAAGNEGGTLLEGRLYSNEYVSVVALNNNPTSPQHCILTRDGFKYQVSFDNVDPYNFPLTSNNVGIMRGDYTPSYQSAITADVNRVDNIDGWEEDMLYLYDPQAEDADFIVNNKIFFNTPNSDMPSAAITTDIFSNNTHETWLYNVPAPINLNIIEFQFTGSNALDPPCDDGSAEIENAAYLIFTSTLGGRGTLELDLNSDGDFDDPTDRAITQFINANGDSMVWDGLDGLGDLVLLPDGFEMNYRMRVRGGEIHILMEDVENDLGGVSFLLVNADGEIDHNDEFYYDHTSFGAPTDVSGGGTPGNALPTTIPFTYSNNYGNVKLLDYWTFVDYGETASAIFNFDMVFDCADEKDTDMDGILDIVDIDDDNDGVPDVLEYCSADGTFDCLPGGLDPSGDSDGDGVVNYLDADDPAFILDCADANGDGICDELPAVFDTDSDGVPNHLDLDSDQDGILDLVEAGHLQIDANGDGIIDGLPAEFGENGLYNPIASDPNALDATATYTPWDKDGDGVEDYHDLDSDNDGIHDVEEAGYSNIDTDNDGRINTGMSNDQGLAPLIDPDFTGVPVPLPVDTDMDGIPDWHDLDSDNDRIHDAAEGMGNIPNMDLDGDGIIGSGVLQVDANGLATGDDTGLVLSPTSNPNDTDGDGIPDYKDLDSDNDGINDVAETGNSLDEDDNGMVGIGIPMVDEDGRPIDDNGDFVTLSFVDTDGDGIPDYRDLDSDNDGINDVAEADHPDADGDGIIGTGTPIINDNGQATADAEGTPLTTNSSPTDTDEDGTPDFNDLDTDNDGILDVIEASNPDPDNDGIIGTGDPIVNTNGQAVTGGDGIPVSPTSDPTDTDGDGQPDYRDLDSDNGGISDTDECPNGSPCPDLDDNGVLDVLEVGCNELGGAPILVDLAVEGTLCAGNDIVLTAMNSLDTITGDITYTWTGPNGFIFTDSVAPNAPFVVTLSNVSVADTGLYTITAFQTMECPASPVSITFTINPIPETPVIITDSELNCPTDSIVFTTTAYNGEVSYDWYLDDQLFTTTTEPSLTVDPTASMSGTYSVIVTVNACSSATSEGLFVNIGEAPTIIDLSPIASQCVGDDVILSASNGNTNITGDIIYTWNGPNDFTFTDTVLSTSIFVATLPEVNVGDSGEYTLMIVSDMECPAQPASITLTINPIPEIPVMMTASELNCPTNPIVFTTTAYDGDVSYDWYLNDELLTTTTEPSLTVNPTASMSGTYSVIATVNGCSSVVSEGLFVNIGETPAIIDLSPTASQCEGDDIVLSAGNGNINITGDIIYTWDGPNGFTFTDTVSSTNMFVATLSGASVGDAGEYTLMIVSDMGCPAEPASLTLTINSTPDTPTITANSNQVCEGESIVLNTTAYDGNVSYEWFFTDADGNTVSVGTTTDPSLTLSGANPDQTGTYSVMVAVEGCESAVSEGVEVMILETLEPVDLTNSTSEDNPACIGDEVQLNAPEIDGATYEWSGPNGFMSNIFNPVISPVSAADAGEYTVMVSLGDCDPVTSNSTTVFIYEPVVPVIADTGTFCEGETVTISVQNDLDLPDNQTVTYEWFQNGVSVATTSDPSLTIDNAMVANSGTYTLVVTVGNCSSELSNAIDLTIQAVPMEEAAVVDENLTVCDDGSYPISAIASDIYAGMWTTTSGATIADPNSAETTVSNLDLGANEFVWTLIDPICGDFASATLVINRIDGTVTAADDELVTDSNTAATVDVLANDDTNNGVIVTVTTAPTSGTVTINDQGIATYTPNPNFYGDDNFTYQICNAVCSDICAEATVNVTVTGTCDVPNTFTPNGDGLNDAFIVPCLETDRQNNRLQIFNRWGDIVFEQDEYRNDWTGTYNDNPLPPGVYFYCLFYDQNDTEPVQGYITIVR